MKRILLSLATVGVLSALITGSTLALFTADPKSQSNTFSAGTVTLGSIAVAECDAKNLAPGDSHTCTVEVKYTGSLEAFIGVQVSKSGDLFAGSKPATVELSGGQDWHKGYYLLGKYADNGKASVTATVRFPAEAGNGYQGAKGTVTLTFVAVQAKNNEQNGKPKSWN